MYKVILWSLLVTVILIGRVFAETIQLVPVRPQNPQPCVQYFVIHGKGYCSSKQVGKPQKDIALADGYTSIHIKFDTSDWKLAWWNHKLSQPIFEYVRTGENLTNWTEMVTENFYPEPTGQLTPQRLMVKSIEVLQKKGFKPKAHLLVNQPNEVVYEWQITGTPAFNQYTLVRIMADKRGLHGLTYERRPKISKQRREQWIHLISKATLKESPSL